MQCAVKARSRILACNSSPTTVQLATQAAPSGVALERRNATHHWWEVECRPGLHLPSCFHCTLVSVWSLDVDCRRLGQSRSIRKSLFIAVIFLTLEGLLRADFSNVVFFLFCFFFLFVNIFSFGISIKMMAS
uniref:Uncharacterized protein n=1 Tax=Anguilla anguilla TaxID=7936 RepID=A0A0E9WXM5_ANGAN